jgi:hypothetical protein
MKVLLTGGIGKSRAGPRTQAARQGRHARHSRCSPASVLEGREPCSSAVRTGPLEADGDLSRLDCIVHIAAWHGIHEDRGEKDAYDFFDLNVRGTFEVSYHRILVTA